MTEWHTLFSRPLWFDEYCTYLVASRGTWLLSLHALAQGAEYNPPLLFWLYRALHAAGLPFAPMAMRIVSLASVCIAIGLLYRILLRYAGRSRAAVAALATAAMPATVSAAFDARYYGPMIALAAALAAIAERPNDYPLIRGGALFATAAALCSLHWFGVLVVVLALAAILVQCLLQQRRPPFWLASLAAGMIVTVLWMPLYRGQVRALSISTWVQLPSVSDVAIFLNSTYDAHEMILVMFGACLGALVATRHGTRPSSHASELPFDRQWRSSYGVAILIGYSAMPLVLLGFSFLVQPVVVTRYAVVATLPVGMGIALLLRRMAQISTVVAFAMLLVFCVARLTQLAAIDSVFASDVQTTRSSLATALPADAVAVSLTGHEAYARAGADPAHGAWPVVVDYTRTSFFCLGRLTKALCDGLTVQRDIARIHRRVYGFPVLASLDSLREATHIYVIERGQAGEHKFDSTLAAALFPDFAQHRVAPNLYLLSRMQQIESNNRVSHEP